MVKKKAAQKPKPKVEGELAADVPHTYIMGLGDQGVGKTSIYGWRVTSRQLYLLRKRHSFLAAVHNAIVKQVKKVELVVVPKDPGVKFNEKTKERMEQFISAGFGPFGEKELRGRLVDVKKWNGDAFAEIVFALDTKEPLMVNYIYAETMRILPDDHGQIIGYPQVVDGVLNTVFAPENIIHLKEHEDEYSLFGFSDIESLFGALLLDSLADEHSISKLKNDATPAGILAFPQTADDTSMARLRTEFIIQLRQNPNKPVFLNGIPQWIPMSIGSIKDMDFVELHRQVRERVMMVYGVLPMQLAVVETGKLANPDQQLEIGEEYIRQELEQIQAAYNLKLTPFFMESENLMFKFTELQPKLETLKNEADIALVKAQIAKELSSISETFTKDEIREISGHEPLKAGGDEFVTGPALPGLFGAAAQGISSKAVQGKPFAGYEDFQDCVDQNQDKDNPQAYCAAIMQQTEDTAFEAKALKMSSDIRIRGRNLIMDHLESIYVRFVKEAIKAAKANPPNPKAAPISSTKGVTEFLLKLGPLIDKLREDMENSVKADVTDIFTGSKGGLGFSFNQRDERTILALLNSDRGAFNAVRSFTGSQKEGLHAVLIDSFNQGTSIPDMVRAMRDFSDQETWKLERIARTESHRMVFHGRVAGYKELEERRGEEYEYNWTGPDDEKTSDECKAILDGNSYPLDELVRLTNGGLVHPNERHTITRVVK